MISASVSGSKLESVLFEQEIKINTAAIRYK
jgi:hypothetical protein